MSSCLADAPRNLGKRTAKLAVPLMVALVSCATLRDVAAQSSDARAPNNAVQGFAQNRDQPISIEAASLEMRDKKKEATFSGKVKVVQGDTTMTSKALVVFYATGPPTAAPKATKSAPLQSATPGPGGSSSIRRLEARGSVVVVQKDQVVTGETATFDTRANLITVAGGVVLTQCRNVLRGSRLLVDMTTGVSRVESDNGMVHVLVDQSSNSGCGPSGAPTGPSVSGAKK